MLLLDKRGFSLVEMMVALAILGFVLTLGFTFYAFGANSFNTGQSQSNVQQNTRLAADIISKEVRFASSLEIIAVNESYTFSPQKRYIYVKDGSFKIRKSGVEESLLESISNNMVFSLKFSRDKKGDKVLYFEVNADNSGRISTVDSAVQILNINDIGIEPDEPESAVFSGNAICYTISATAASDAVSVAAAITSVDAPAPNATQLTMPAVPPGFTIVIKDSNKNVIDDTNGITNGTIDPPIEATIVTLIFTVTKTSDNSTADTIAIEVEVPAKIAYLNLSGVNYHVADGIITDTTTEMEYNLNGGSGGSSGSWSSAADGNTPVTFTAGTVWVREVEHPTNKRQLAVIAMPVNAPSVFVSHDNKTAAEFRKNSKNGTAVTTEDGYEYSKNSGPWTNILTSHTIDTTGTNIIIVRVKATSIKLPSQQTENIDN